MRSTLFATAALCAAALSTTPAMAADVGNGIGDTASDRQDRDGGDCESNAMNARVHCSPYSVRAWCPATPQNLEGLTRSAYDDPMLVSTEPPVRGSEPSDVAAAPDCRRGSRPLRP